jgi:hypothetical protein
LQSKRENAKGSEKTNRKKGAKKSRKKSKNTIKIKPLPLCGAKKRAKIKGAKKRKLKYLKTLFVKVRKRRTDRAAKNQANQTTTKNKITLAVQA